jgi:hypothetical protein
VATRPKLGGQRIIGRFRNATVYRHEQPSNSKERDCFPYSIEALAEDALLVPAERRSFVIPRRQRCFWGGQCLLSAQFRWLPEERGAVDGWGCRIRRFLPA